ncbi:MAG TPA: hypothetical protein VM821_05880, partial [Abditibacteriaceae bacterium]|nr:hypothetical protein [Abditibacteriaceae bacterium]
MAHNDLKLNAGPLSMIFERDLAFLRYVKLLDREVLRGIYCAVRDSNWGTIAPRVSMIEERVNSFSFHLVFDVEHLRDGIHFVWRGELSGDENGTIEYSMRGAAQTDFLSNRVGFCVLHLEPKGSHFCVVEHSDGQREGTFFPRVISPHQPFKDVRAIEDRVCSRTFRVEMNGEVFETEDQRNWTDNSFKTYCRPHDWPRPFEVVAGNVVEQNVKVSLVKEDAVTIKVGDDSISLPKIGLQLAPQTHNAQQIEALQKLNLSHLRVELDLSKNDVAALRHATPFDLPLEIALFLSDNAEDELRELVRV